MAFFFTVQVSGESMWPDLVPGKRYIASSFFKPRIGHYLIFKNPKRPKEILVKKVVKIHPTYYEVAGTIPWAPSTDEIGPVPKRNVLGKIIFKNWNW